MALIRMPFAVWVAFHLMSVRLFWRVVCASLMTVSILATQPAVVTANFYENYGSEEAAEAACLESFKAENAPGGFNRRIQETSNAFYNSERHDKWVQDSLARQSTDDKFCLGYDASLIRGDWGGTGWRYFKALTSCQISSDPRSLIVPTRDLKLFPIIAAAPRLTGLQMVRGGTTNGDFPMFGGVFTPHRVHFVSWEMASDKRFDNVIYSTGKYPYVSNSACLYPDRLDKKNEGKDLSSIWSTAATWQFIPVPGWIKGDNWLRVTVTTPGLGSDSFASSVFFPDGHGMSRYEKPQQSPSVVDIAVEDDSLTTTVVGSTYPYREITICVWTVSKNNQQNQNCAPLRKESKQAYFGGSDTYDFNWREVTRSTSQGQLVKLTVSVTNDYGSDSMEFSVEQAEQKELAPKTASVSTPASVNSQIPCRRGTTVRRFKKTVCPSGWRPASRP